MRTTTLALALALVGTFHVRARETQGVLDTIAPFESHGPIYGPDNVEALRPRVMGTRGVVSTGHYRATMAGLEALRDGGNAFDAGVVAAMALKVVKMDYAGWTGVAPAILYSARDGEVMTRVGAGTSPRRATLAHFLEHGKTEINQALVPADVDVWLAVLERYGTFSFRRAVEPALELAEHGYHIYAMQKWRIDAFRDRILEFPYNARFWFQNGRKKSELGARMVNADLGKLMRYMMDAEGQMVAKGASREEGIRAARDAFYKGAPARAVGELYAEYEDGLVTYDDMAHYEGKWMAPLHTRFMGYDVYVCDGWSQGPRLILFLNMLESFDLQALGYNTPEYIHVLSQAIELGMADSHRYVADPEVADIPEALFSREYARRRAELIDMEKAFPDMPPWGDPERGKAISPDSPRQFSTLLVPSNTSHEEGDTSSVNVMDGKGNVFSLTESDYHLFTPMIPGWGFGLGRRMSQFNLDDSLANVMAPNKRPRNTNSPIIVMKERKPFLGLSTPGADQQLQALLQVFLNVALWGMSPQQALDQPRFGSENFPETGSEVNQTPGRLSFEERIPRETREALARLGHDVHSWGLWSHLVGAPTITYRDPDSGLLMAGADVRRETSALGF